MKKIQTQWDTSLLTQMGVWMCLKEEYGHGLFVIHGCHLGIKTKHQIKLRWKDFIDEKGMVKDILKFENINDRELGNIVKNITQKVYEDMNNPKRESMLYVNKNTKKPLSTKTLNRELNKLARLYREVIDPKEKKDPTDKITIRLMKQMFGPLMLIEKYPLTTAHLEIAWASDYLKHHRYNIRAFRRVSRVMNHTSLQQTIDAIGIKPDEEDDLLPKYNYHESSKYFKQIIIPYTNPRREPY